jgi:hypothetical protein
MGLARRGKSKLVKSGDFERPMLVLIGARLCPDPVEIRFGLSRDGRSALVQVVRDEDR